MDLFRLVKNQRDRALAVLATIVGLILLVAGWVGLSGKNLTTEQIPYLASGAVGALFALGLAATLWLSADLRDEHRTLQDIFEWMRTEGQAPIEAEAPFLHQVSISEGAAREVPGKHAAVSTQSS